VGIGQYFPANRRIACGFFGDILGIRGSYRSCGEWGGVYGAMAHGKSGVECAYFGDYCRMAAVCSQGVGAAMQFRLGCFELGRGAGPDRLVGGPFGHVDANNVLEHGGVAGVYDLSGSCGQRGAMGRVAHERHMWDWGAHAVGCFDLDAGMGAYQTGHGVDACLGMAVPPTVIRASGGCAPKAQAVQTVAPIIRRPAYGKLPPYCFAG
jgi:hypothetical protein